MDFVLKCIKASSPKILLFYIKLKIEGFSNTKNFKNSSVSNKEACCSINTFSTLEISKLQTNAWNYPKAQKKLLDLKKVEKNTLNLQRLSKEKHFLHIFNLNKLQIYVFYFNPPFTHSKIPIQNPCLHFPLLSRFTQKTFPLSRS